MKKRLCIFPTGLTVTPGHPILINSTWVFPKQVVQPSIEPCSAVYNLVLSQDHIAIINGTPLILLGHGYKSGIL